MVGGVGGSIDTGARGRPVTPSDNPAQATARRGVVAPGLAHEFTESISESLLEADGHELKFDVEKGGASEEVTAWSEESEEALTPEHAAAR